MGDCEASVTEKRLLPLICLFDTEDERLAGSTLSADVCGPKSGVHFIWGQTHALKSLDLILTARGAHSRRRSIASVPRGLPRQSGTASADRRPGGGSSGRGTRTRFAGRTRTSLRLLGVLRVLHDNNRDPQFRRDPLQRATALVLVRCAPRRVVEDYEGEPSQGFA